MSTANPYQTPDANLSAGGDDYLNLSPLSPKGRLGRIRYLAYALGLSLAAFAIVAVIIGVTGGLGALATGSVEGLMGGMGVAAILISIPVFIALMVFSIFLVIKRLHDMNWSGWVALPFFLLPYLGAALMFVSPVLYFACIAVQMVVGLLLVFYPGTRGANAYGAETPPNGLGVTIAGLALPVIVVVGIVAAVAIPAYQGYGQRAKQAEMSPPAPDMAPAAADGAIVPAQESVESAMPAEGMEQSPPTEEMPTEEEAPAEE